MRLLFSSSLSFLHLQSTPFPITESAVSERGFAGEGHPPSPSLNSEETTKKRRRWRRWQHPENHTREGELHWCEQRTQRTRKLVRESFRTSFRIRNRFGITNTRTVIRDVTVSICGHAGYFRRKIKSLGGDYFVRN